MVYRISNINIITITLNKEGGLMDEQNVYDRPWHKKEWFLFLLIITAILLLMFSIMILAVMFNTHVLITICNVPLQLLKDISGGT